MATIEERQEALEQELATLKAEKRSDTKRLDERLDEGEREFKLTKKPQRACRSCGTYFPESYHYCYNCGSWFMPEI